jgi:hypothetical protein
MTALLCHESWLPGRVSGLWKRQLTALAGDLLGISGIPSWGELTEPKAVLLGKPLMTPLWAQAVRTIGNKYVHAQPTQGAATTVPAGSSCCWDTEATSWRRAWHKPHTEAARHWLYIINDVLPVLSLRWMTSLCHAPDRRTLELMVDSVSHTVRHMYAHGTREGRHMPRWNRLL